MPIVALSTRDQRLSALIRGPLPDIDVGTIASNTTNTLVLRNGSRWVSTNGVMYEVQNEPANPGGLTYPFGGSFSPTSRAQYLMANNNQIADVIVNRNSVSSVNNIRDNIRAGAIIGQRVRLSPTQQRFIPVNRPYIPVARRQMITQSTRFVYIHLVCYSTTEFSYAGTSSSLNLGAVVPNFFVRIINYSALGVGTIDTEATSDPRINQDSMFVNYEPLQINVVHLRYTRVFQPGYYVIDMTLSQEVGALSLESIQLMGDAEYRLSNNND